MEEEKKELEKIDETKEEIVEKDDSVKISNDVIATIAGTVVSQVQGVYSTAGGISELFGKKSATKGIKVDSTEGDIKIDVNIVVEYGVRIPDVAFEIQNKVKKAIETMTGLNVSNVNIHIQGINIPEKRDEEESRSQEENNQM